LQIHPGSAEPFFDIYGHAENVRGADFFAGTKRRSVLAASGSVLALTTCPPFVELSQNNHSRIS
jgi:hypothetical protein